MVSFKPTSHPTKKSPPKNLFPKKAHFSFLIFIHYSVNTTKAVFFGCAVKISPRIFVTTMHNIVIININYATTFFSYPQKSEL